MVVWASSSSMSLRVRSSKSRNCAFRSSNSLGTWDSSGSSQLIENLMEEVEYSRKARPRGLQPLRPCRIHLIRVHAQLLHGIGCAGGIEFTVAGQAREGCRDNRFGIDLKVTPQMLAVVAASESVCPQRYQPRTQPG